MFIVVSVSFDLSLDCLTLVQLQRLHRDSRNKKMIMNGQNVRLWKDAFRDVTFATFRFGGANLSSGHMSAQNYGNLTRVACNIFNAFRKARRKGVKSSFPYSFCTAFLFT